MSYHYTQISCSDGLCGDDDCGRCYPLTRPSTRRDIMPDEDRLDELLSDAEASGLINDSIDRCFEATMRRAE